MTFRTIQQITERHDSEVASEEPKPGRQLHDRLRIVKHEQHRKQP